MKLKAVFMCLAVCLLVAGCQTTGVSSKTIKKALLMVEENGTSRVLKAYVLDSGKLGVNEPFELRNTLNQPLCRGNYSLLTRNGNGTVQMSCFGGRMSGSGTYENKGNRNGTNYGIGVINAGTSQIKVIFGVTDAEFMRVSEG